MLEPFVPNTIPNRAPPLPPPVEVDGEIQHEVAQILNSAINKQRHIKLQYRVQWAGYEGTSEEFSWVDASDVANANVLVALFHQKYPNKPGPDPNYFTPPDPSELEDL